MTHCRSDRSWQTDMKIISALGSQHIYLRYSGPRPYTICRAVTCLHPFEQALGNEVSDHFFHQRNLLTGRFLRHPMLNNPFQRILSMGLTCQIVEYIAGDLNFVRRTFFHGDSLFDDLAPGHLAGLAQV